MQSLLISSPSTISPAGDVRSKRPSTTGATKRKSSGGSILNDVAAAILRDDRPAGSGVRRPDSAHLMAAVARTSTYLDSACPHTNPSSNTNPSSLNTNPPSNTNPHSQN